MNNSVQKLNSLVPMASNVIQAPVQAINSAMNSAVNTAKNTFGALNSGMNKAMNAIPLLSPTNVNAPGAGSWNTALMWFGGFVLIFLILLAFYYEQFMVSLQSWMDSLRMYFGGSSVPPPSPPQEQPTQAPISPQEDASSPSASVVEKILPPGKEVFSVSKNDFTFYDAAPLCKALGAELATYDQVKSAWQKGADWCNYGWVKGQMAVYPTQKSTYEELQQGPAEQRLACGRPGVNGGYFDNPEMKFGVTCYGPKPSQSQHDATQVTKGATRPLTAAGLEFEKKVQRFADAADTMGILPFSGDKWQSN
jgi:hypothetical protein